MSRSGALAVARTRAVSWPAPPTTHTISARPLPAVAIHADLSCAFGTLLTAWTFAAGFLPETDPGHTTVAYWAAGVVGAVCVAASLLLHEIGHAVAARRAGLGVARIALSFGGGISEITGTVRRPRDEFFIAAAGPIASFATMVVAVVAHVLLVETSGAGLPATVAALVAVGNLALVLLNLLPGLPLDGGRILRAALWTMMRRPETATRVALGIGRRLGEGLIVIAALASAFGFIWIALWGAFLGFTMRESV